MEPPTTPDRRRNHDVRPTSTTNAGEQRLLHDLAVIGQATKEHPPARERLEQQLGTDLTQTLLTLLATTPPLGSDTPAPAHHRAA
jgi:hypothetical protein